MILTISINQFLFETLKGGVKAGINKLNESNDRNRELVRKANERRRKMNASGSAE